MADAPNPGPILIEAIATTGAALLAGYVRGRGNPKPLSLDSLCARVCEAVVCGALASGIASVIEADGVRVTVALSAALGLLGAGVIGDALAAWVQRRAGR